jgi:hypothetical protein
MKIIDTNNAITVEVTLTHPDISPRFNTYVIDFGNDMEIDTNEIIKAFKQRFKNSYYHEMEIVAVYVFDNEIYRKTMYNGGIL